MQFRRGALSRLRNATSIPLDKLEAHESDRKHCVDVETQVVNQALRCPRHHVTYAPQNIPVQHHITYFVRKLQSRDVFPNII